MKIEKFENYQISKKWKVWKWPMPFYILGPHCRICVNQPRVSTSLWNKVEEGERVNIFVSKFTFGFFQAECEWIMLSGLIQSNSFCGRPTPFTREDKDYSTKYFTRVNKSKVSQIIFLFWHFLVHPTSEKCPKNWIISMKIEWL